VVEQFESWIQYNSSMSNTIGYISLLFTYYQASVSSLYVSALLRIIRDKEKPTIHPTIQRYDEV